MLRMLLCAVIALPLAAVAGEEKPPLGTKETLKGVIKKVDPSAQQLIVKIPGKKAVPDRMLDILPSTRFVFQSGSDKKELVGKKAFAEKRLAENAEVTVFLNAEGRPIEVHVRPPRNPGR